MSKLYHSISEVAEILGVNQSLLRFWEKEFEPLINPHKNSKGTRFYREEDIEIIKLIHHLVKTQGLTLPGAKKKILQNKSEAKANQEIYERLQKVRNELVSIRKLITLPSEEIYESQPNEEV